MDAVLNAGSIAAYPRPSESALGPILAQEKPGLHTAAGSVVNAHCPATVLPLGRQVALPPPSSKLSLPVGGRNCVGFAGKIECVRATPPGSPDSLSSPSPAAVAGSHSSNTRSGRESDPL